MMQTRFKKSVTIVIAALCAALLLAVIGTTVFMQSSRAAHAYSELPTGENVIENLYDSESGYFSKDNLDKLAQSIKNGDGSSKYADMGNLIKFICLGDVGNTIQSSAFGETVVKFGKSNNGEELVWIPAYVSKSISGAPILTLWLARTDGENSTGKQQEVSTFSDGTWNNNADTNPSSNNYSTSMIRVKTLNNGGAYYSGYVDSENQVTPTKNEHTATSNKSNKFEMYTTGALASYIVTPSDVDWQKNANWQKNDPKWQVDNNGNYTGNGHYSCEWLNDKLWLPSVHEVYDSSETATSTSTTFTKNGGIWEMTVSEFKNSIFFWLRSGYPDNYSYSYVLNSDGSYHIIVNQPYGVRPALHLNLTKAAETYMNYEVTAGTTTTKYATIEEAFTAANSIGNETTKATVKLYENATAVSTLIVNEGANVKLDLNNCALALDPDAGSGSVIRVYGTLEVTDTAAGGALIEHQITDPATGGAKRVYGGVITGGKGKSADINKLGGGIYVEGSLTLSGGTIAGNTADYGGGVRVDEGATFIMTGGAISYNTASQDAGGLCVYAAAKIELNGGYISDNTAENGGGIYLEDNRGSTNVYIINGVTVSRNSATKGGGIYTDKSNISLLSGIIGGSEVNKNSVKGMNSRGGGVYISGGSFTMEGGAVSYNAAESQGGGVYASGTFTMKGGTISYNIVNRDGGGVYLSGSPFNMDGGEILNNTAESGGGVYLFGGVARFTMQSGKIIGNFASWGGGVCIDMNGALTMETINCEIINNGAEYGGGGVFVSYGTFNLNNGYVRENAGNYSGGVHVRGQNENFKARFNMTGGYVRDNFAYADFGNSNSNAYASVGGVSVYTNGIFNMTGGSIVENNVIRQSKSNTRFYGGVYVHVDGTFNVSGDVLVADNEAEERIQKSEESTVKSNVFVSAENQITFTGALRENSAKIGVTLQSDGVFTSGYGEFNKNGNDVIPPKAYFVLDNDKYPCMYLSEDEAAVGRHSVINGACENCGAGVAASVTVGSGSSATVSYYGTLDDAWNAAIAAGTATVQLLDIATIISPLHVPNEKNITLDLNGYMIALASGANESVIKVSEGSFTLEDTYTEGDRKYNVNGKTIVGGVITGGDANNDDASAGGGVIIECGAFIMNGGTIAGNNARVGGGVFLDRGTFTMNGGAITYNTASQYGGGVYLNGGTFTMNDGTISYNTAEEQAGGVAMNMTPQVIMTGGSIIGNTAAEYGGIRVYGGDFKISGAVQIRDNKMIDGESAKNSNVCLVAEITKITIDGELNDVNYNCAYIGVTLSESYSGAFTSGYKVNSDCNHPSVYFFGDDCKAIEFDEDQNEAIVSSAVYVHTFNGDGVCRNCGATAAVKITYTETDFTGNLYFDSVNEAFEETSKSPLYQCLKVQMQLLCDVTASSKLYVYRDMTLDLNGYMIALASGVTDVVLSIIGSNRALTLIDTYKGNDRKRVVNEEEIVGGVITGGNTSRLEGGGVYVAYEGVFNMDGGKIIGNSSGYGGGVYIEQHGAFTMTDGIISGNNAKHAGGGVCVQEGTFKMLGGRICGNKADSYGDGGGVYVMFNSLFDMAGGTISDNMARAGGGIFVNTSIFDMAGGTVSGNSSTQAGGVFVSVDSNFNMRGGVITKNIDNIKNYESDGTLYHHGGGVHVAGKFNIWGKVNITGNKSGSGEYEVINNVYVCANAKITVRGALTASQIGVSLENDSPFTTDYSTYNTVDGKPVAPSTYFLSDDSAYDCVYLDSDGEVQLDVHEWDSGKITTAATCKNKGVKTYACGHDSAHTRTEEIPIDANVHVYATAWSSDASGHWHAATCEHTTAKGGAGNHAAGDWIVDTPAQIGVKGSKHKECTVCGYVTERAEIPAIAPEHEHTFATGWTSDATGHWHAATCEHISQKSGFAAHTVGNWIVDTPAQIGVDGSKHKECTVCGYVTERADIPAIAPEHEHTFETGWTWDATGHWHAATCEHISQKKDFAAHIAGEWIVDTPALIGVAGSRHKECTVCGYTVQTETLPALKGELVKPDGNGADDKVIITAPNGFAPDIELAVSEIAKDDYSQYDSIAQAANGKISFVYDVNLKSSGATVQPDGTVTVKLLIPEAVRGKDFKLFNLYGSTSTELQYTIEDNYVVVTTDKLSEFIFVGDKEAVATNNSVWIVLIAILAAIIAAELSYITVKEVRRVKAKEDRK